MLVRFNHYGNTLNGWLNRGHIISAGEIFDLKEVKLLSPCLPTKIVCVGLNYLEHAYELGMRLPEDPIIFMKPPSAAIGPEEEIIYPPSSTRVDYEGELAVVIGKKAKDISASFAYDYILGYTCFNDVTARDLQQKDEQWTRSKSFDTFAPLGPSIAYIDPSDLDIRTRLNGALKQDSNTSDLIFSVPKLIEFVSSIMTLVPGDVIATGTPPGIGPINIGDTVEVEIEGIGVLRNFVRCW